jgi:hypothetical protein
MTGDAQNAGRISFVPESTDKHESLRAAYRGMLSRSDRRLGIIVRASYYVALIAAVLVGVPAFSLLRPYYGEWVRIGPFVIIVLVSVAYYSWCVKRFVFFDRRRRKRVGDRPIDVWFSDGVLQSSRAGATMTVPHRSIDLIFETPKVFGFLVDEGMIFLPKTAVTQQSFPIDALISDVLEAMAPDARARSVASLKSRR